MSDKDLQEIQSLQFTDLEAANQLLKDFFKNNLPFNVKSVNLRPLAVSLNSINGIIITEEGEKLFFKTHGLTRASRHIVGATEQKEQSTN